MRIQRFRWPRRAMQRLGRAVQRLGRAVQWLGRAMQWLGRALWRRAGDLWRRGRGRGSRRKWDNLPTTVGAETEIFRQRLAAVGTETGSPVRGRACFRVLLGIHRSIYLTGKYFFITGRPKRATGSRGARTGNASARCRRRKHRAAQRGRRSPATGSGERAAPTADMRCTLAAAGRAKRRRPSTVGPQCQSLRNTPPTSAAARKERAAP